MSFAEDDGDKNLPTVQEQQLGRAVVDASSSRRRFTTKAMSSVSFAEDDSGKRRSTVEELRTAVVDASGSKRRLVVKARLSTSTLAQLRLSNLKIHGREEADMALLKDKLSNIRNVGRELTLVAGVSGVGKSALGTRV